VMRMRRLSTSFCYLLLGAHTGVNYPKEIAKYHVMEQLRTSWLIDGEHSETFSLTLAKDLGLMKWWTGGRVVICSLLLSESYKTQYFKPMIDEASICCHRFYSPNIITGSDCAHSKRKDDQHTT
jgi:hypothetical protein